MPDMSESDLQTLSADYLGRFLPDDATAWHTPNGGSRNKIEAAKLKRQGVTAGVADWLILYRGRLYCIELKTRKGRLSPVQKSWSETILNAGSAAYEVCRSLEEIQDCLMRWQIPMKARLI